MQKNYFQKNAGFLYIVERWKLNTRKCSHFCWPCKQTSADPTVRFTNINEDEDMLKNVSHGKPLEREFMVHHKSCKEYTCLLKDETVRYLKFHIKNLNSFSSFFTINAYNNFLEVFCVKLIWLLKHHFWDTKWCRPNRTTLFASQNLISTKPFV